MDPQQPSAHWDKLPCWDEEGEYLEPDLYDFYGELLRGRFLRHCAGEDESVLHSIGEACPQGSPTDYLAYRFAIDLESLSETGRLRKLGLFGTSYNHRIRRLAVNLVGAQVRDCAAHGYPAACVYDSTVRYDLVQSGRVHVRTREGRTRIAELPRGGVRSGKALAAERSVTSPIRAEDAALLDRVWATELQGRPLQGMYELRLYPSEYFVWDRVEDIQVVLEMDYWTPFDLE